jgi:hypothetical protein
MSSLRTFCTSGLLALVVAGPSTACSLTDASTPSGSGASNGYGGSSTTYVPPKCDQGCQDYLVAWALDDTLWFAWNQKLAGQPVGMQDATASCALGGTVHITGSDAVTPSGATTTDLVFSFEDCANAREAYDLTFTGEVTMEGTFDPDIEFAALTFAVPALEVRGSLKILDDPPIDQSCPVNFGQQGTGEAFELAGRICGRSFDESSLDRGGSSNDNGSGGSSNGSGGSNAASGSGNDCTCFCPDGRVCTGVQGSNPCGVDADGIPEPCGCPVDCH